MNDSESLQAQIDALRLLVISLVAAQPDPKAVAAAALSGLSAWVLMHEPRAVTDSYLDLLDEELQKTSVMLKKVVIRTRPATD